MKGRISTPLRYEPQIFRFQKKFNLLVVTVNKSTAINPPGGHVITH